jgi:C4-dicarboxylate-specific signal transduction histidine kinase
MGDRVQLQQVLMNLMMNSIDAMKDVMGRASSPSSHSVVKMVRG